MGLSPNVLKYAQKIASVDKEVDKGPDGKITSQVWMDTFLPMIIRQLWQASCTLACFEAFLAQNGICITQRRMKVLRPDLCGNLDDENRCVYTHVYSEIGRAFGFTCSEIVDSHVLFPSYPASAILMGTDALTGTPHSLLWTHLNKANGVGFAMNPADDHPSVYFERCERYRVTSS